MSVHWVVIAMVGGVAAFPVNAHASEVRVVEALVEG